MPLADILILSNGPGEIVTWVRPVVRELRHRLPDVRLSLVLSPDTHASGQEAELARNHLNLDRVQEPKHFLRFLLTGRTAHQWDWCSRGVVLFLGGDQFFAVVFAKRLGYQSIVYAEWEARWPRYIDRFAVRTQEIAAKQPQRWQSKFHIVGDLMADGLDSQPMSVERLLQLPAVNDDPPTNPTELETIAIDTGATQPQTDTTASAIQSQNLSWLPWGWQSAKTERNHFQVALLPGSKPAKLSLGVPLVLAVADRLRQRHINARFAIPVAPTLSVSQLTEFAQVRHNSDIATIYGTTAVVEDGWRGFQFITPYGTTVSLWTDFPSAPLLANADLCITTVGANTAELARLGIPMIVVIPTNKLDAMRAWDGILGLVVNIPILGRAIAKLVNWIAHRFLGLLAWPNIWAGEEIVPELRGHLTPQDVSDVAYDLLVDRERRRAIAERLKEWQAQPGAAEAIAKLVHEQLQTVSELPAAPPQPTDLPIQ